MGTKARIVRVGNSRGIRIPKVLLDQAQLPDEVAHLYGAPSNRVAG